MVFVFNLQSYNKFLKLQKNKNAVSICLNKESKKQNARLSELNKDSRAFFFIL